MACRAMRRGLPDFKYVATHICDSIKRRLKADGNGTGLQGEFGIGLLSFWTVGDMLTMTSTGTDQKAYQMTMSKGDSRYDVSPKRVMFAEKGTELKISPLLEGIRTLSGEKIQWYLASELRDRIRDSKARVTVIDKLARKQYEVEPRQFEGRLLHQLPPIRTAFGDAYAELYLAEPNESARVALTRVGTRVIEDISSLPGLEHAPWVSRYVQGLIDVPFLTLTPGTRTGIIQDERYAALIEACAAARSARQRSDRGATARRRRTGEPAITQSHPARLSMRPCWRFRARNTIGSMCRGARARKEESQAPPPPAFLQVPTGMRNCCRACRSPSPSDSPQRQFFDFAGPSIQRRRVACREHRAAQ
jgi:hypothetical protein